MKKVILLILLTISYFVNAQNKGDVSLDWILNQKISYNTFAVNSPQINAEGFEFDLAKKQVFFNLKLPQSTSIDENSLQISNVVYENISNLELGELNKNNIPATINAKLFNLIGRDDFKALITISPIIYKEGNYQKVKSFSYSFSSADSNKNIVANSVAAVSNSVLASGDWYRFFVTTSGVYIINKAFLTSLGINVNAIDPKKIKIYGNGGRMLPLTNSIPYPDDLAENAIQVFGETDNVFNDNDFVLFYAEGVDSWNQESQTFINLYSDKSYYYINVQGADGKRIASMPQPTGAATATISTFNGANFHEVDKINLGRLGRRWFGESFDVNNEQTFNFNIPNTVAGSQINIAIGYAAKGGNTTSFNTKINNVDFGNSSLSANPFYSQSYFSANIAAIDNVSLKLAFSNGGVPSTIGYIDNIIIKSIRDLKGYGKQFHFQYDTAASMIGIGQYNLTNTTAISQIWNITDINNVTKIENNPAQATLSFKTSLGSLQKYIAIDYADLYVPGKDTTTKIGNQNLHGTIFNNASGQFEDIDYLIITPGFLASQAESLANFHRSYSNLNTKVVTLESIYPEFGSGKQDVAAIRNFVKYVYNNASSPSERVKYVNLFGDASFDFKNRIPNNINTNIVPIYHALSSNSLGEASFVTDDFFGLMDSNEGYMDSFFGSIDVAVGRMIVSSPQQAQEMVNKVIEYHDIKSYGTWRNNCVFIADDPSLGSSDQELQYYENRLADNVSAQKPFLNIKKIFLDAYVRESTAGGFRYPKARSDFFDAFAKGSLTVNYLGHGGEDGLAQEGIWQKSDGQSLSNQFKYPLFITLTCDFSRFDNPYRQTAGEFTYWNPRGGAIGMITTTREIGQSTAQFFNDILAADLYSYGSNNYTSIADALRIAKNRFSGGTKVVSYLGDPAMMLAIPKPKVVLTKVNDMPISGPIDDFKSLAYIKLTGEIQDESGAIQNSYIGDLSIQIFDKNIPRTTLRNAGADAWIGIGITATYMPFITLGETIYRGNASITNGQFEFGFVVPRDIRIPLGNGKISFYSKRNQILLDKSGYNTDIKIGGVNLLAAADTTPPKVRLFMNDETFVNGGITNQNPIFLAFLDDENGINTAGGIGHDIVAILDGNESNPYILNEYYETELDNYKKGKVKFPFKNLALGLHTITFKAWDVYNNLVTSEIQFVVVDNEGLTLTNVLNYPNPFVNYTQFWFTHNRPFEPLEVQVQVLTITGKVVYSTNQIINTTGFLSKEISWDGKDDFGDKIGKGVYIYKLKVKSTISDASAEKYEKLVIL